MCEPKVEELIVLFNDLFKKTLNTELIAGDDEPVYLASQPGVRETHQIIFAHGFVQSALHEIAHWCVAGPERRLKDDFGYWYKPDGRTEAEQAEFERVEVRPQAYEWILSRCAGIRFNFSADNLDSGLGPSEHFKTEVSRTAQRALKKGLNPRLKALCGALQQRYRTSPPHPSDFLLNG